MSTKRFAHLVLVSVIVLSSTSCVTSMPRVRESETPEGEKILRFQRLNGDAVSFWAHLDGELVWRESMPPDSLHLVLYLKGPVLSTPSGMKPVLDDTLTGRPGPMPLFLPDSMMNDGSPEISSTREAIPGDRSTAYLLPQADTSFSYQTVSDHVSPELVSVNRYAIKAKGKQTRIGVGVPVGGAATVGVVFSGPVHVVPITKLTYRVPRRTVDDIAGNSVRVVNIRLQDDGTAVRGPELQEYEVGEKSAVQFREKLKKVRPSTGPSSSH